MVGKGEAIVAILDIGVCMYCDESNPTHLDVSKKIISRIILRKIFSNSKDEIALVLCGYADKFEKNGRNSNICIVQNLQCASWKLLEILNDDIEGNYVVTEFLRELALETAISLLQNSENANRIDSRKILFFTNFNGYFKNPHVNLLFDQLKKLKIEINFIGPVAITEEMKQPRGINSQFTTKHVSDFLRDVNGKSYSFSDVLSTLTIYQMKTYEPCCSNLILNIGKLSIPISIFIKVRENHPKKWGIAYAHDLSKKTKTRKTFCRDDESQTKVPYEDVIQAYKYGTTIVPYSQVDKKNMKYQSDDKGMTVLGFTTAEKIPRYLYSDLKCSYVYGQKYSKSSGKQLAAFIQALQDVNMVAIVHFVTTPRSAPVIGFLSPRIKENSECLVFVALPFLEDLRPSVFTPLDSDSKNIPTEEQLNAVNELISAMDMTASYDGDDEEILKPKNTVNPYVQRLFQCLEYRALNPKKPLPHIEPHIQALINPEPKLLNRAEISLKKIKSLFPLEEYVPKKLNDSKFKKSDSVCYVDMSIKTEAMDEGVSEEFDITDPKIVEGTQVGPINSVRDIQYLINNKILPFNKICGQINDVIRQLFQEIDRVRFRFPKILSLLKEYRAASLKAKDCKNYNLFMISLEEDLLETNKDIWDKIRNEKIALISTEELPTSTVSSEEAEKFLSNQCLAEIATGPGENVAPPAVVEHRNQNLRIFRRRRAGQFRRRRRRNEGKFRKRWNNLR